MDKKVTYRVRRAFFAPEGIGTHYFELGGDFFDAPGIVKSELMNCDYPWIAVVRVDHSDLGTVLWDTRSSGGIPEVLFEHLDAPPEELWNEIEEVGR